MSFDALVHSIFRRVSVTREDRDAYQANTSKLTTRLLDVVLRTFDLGFTAFGGPPVHFQIFHRRFVDGHGKTPWIDEQTYQELFAISQALPGPASTKMLFNIVHIHAGMVPAILAFLLWSLPGAIAMYGFSVGVQQISETPPLPVYALLSGLNAATVGLIALAAVQLARKAITDPLTRLLVAFGGCAGLCYNALWYFPALLVFAGFVTVAWDMVGRGLLIKWKNKQRNNRRSVTPPEPKQMDEIKSNPSMDALGPQRRQATSDTPPTLEETSPVPSQSPRDASTHAIPVKFGLIAIILFFASFTVFMSIRGALHHSPLLLALFNNMLLAGTIIFGGGPVVIPLLREYVVDPGWVSPRDFLLGLAVIQAMPGPNFNFAVYLGALVVAGPASSKSVPTVVGAILGYLGIFLPGLWLSVGFHSIWQSLRKRREVTSILRGINAAAVGFVFTAVYRLWEIGYLTAEQAKGVSLGQEPWWLVVAASTFTAVEWFSVPPPVAILAGGTAGICWWAAVERH
ncbi:hypothetical protein M413DRAFT_64243 [Hebeloma cylindrosporum]|uniref:Chromate ion transporter n=1 Tax=Hebeloma cylindrosporum TaxID=76867 RepID=A0A0C2Y935_HEBCY|nr:hypothetical protein M413DRAFT_64243 [Hebeloma cylindrosporum h7]